MTTETSKTIVTSAYAVWRLSSSSTRALHSERIAAGTWGRNAPAPSAQRPSTHDGAWRPAATTSATSMSTWAGAARRSTAGWP